MTCPKCSAPLQSVPLPGDIMVETCPHCSGVYYDAAELALELELEGAQATRWFCPKCHSKLETGTVFNGQLQLERCESCRGVWLDAGEVQKLRQLSGREDLVKGSDKPSPKSRPEAVFMDLARGLAAAAGVAGIPGAAIPAGAPGRPARPDEDAQEPEPGDGPIEAPDSGEMDNPDETACPILWHEGRRYDHFQTSWPVADYVLGEFNWKVKAGEKAKARDFICPPSMLSEDVSGGSSVWSQGEYVEASEVAQAFQLPEALPAPRGVHPAQPNPYAGGVSAMTWPCQAAAAACLLLFILAWGLGDRRKAFEASWNHPSLSTERSFVTEPFELGGRTSNVQVKLYADLDNAWAYFAMALINADTDEALDFGREVSYYQGVDDGERWSEGSRRDTCYLPSVKPGRYYLRVEPETSAASFRYTLTLTRDSAQPGLLAWALILLTLPFAAVWLLERRFEYERWKESDHPWVTESDDDDDGDDE